MTKRYYFINPRGELAVTKYLETRRRWFLADYTPIDEARARSTWPEYFTAG